MKYKEYIVTVEVHKKLPQGYCIEGEETKDVNGKNHEVFKISWYEYYFPAKLRRAFFDKCTGEYIGDCHEKN